MTKEEKDNYEQLVGLMIVKDSVIKALQHEVDRLHKILIRRMEEKLLTYMSKKEYKKFSKEVAQEMFFNDIINLPDCPFKDFALDNFQSIVKDANIGGDDDDNNDI